MKKPVPKLRWLVLPALICYLPLTVATEATAAASVRAALPLAVVVQAADITVSGRVTDETGGGLPGVNVVVKGTTNGTQTDADGRYTLTAPDNATLVISYVGYTAKEIAVGGRTTIDIPLSPDAQALNEVVVVGYLQQDREQVTGSVGKVGAEEIRRAPAASLTESIQGRVSGVQVNNSGAPGQNPIVNIRGIGSIALNSNPLYIVDGVWTENIRDINTADIESSTILKDAAALAPYGSRGANGVILVTTRRGKQGKPAFNLSGYAGVQNIYRRLDLANTAQWATITRQMYENAGRLNELYSTAATPPPIDTDWQEELFQTGRIQDYNLGVSGASETANYSVSAGYFNQKGTIVGPTFERYSLRLNTGVNRGKFRVSQSAQLSRSNTRRVIGVEGGNGSNAAQAGNGTAAIAGSPFIEVIRMLPVIPVLDPTTVSGYGFGNTDQVTFGINPVGSQLVYNDQNTENRLLGSIVPEFNITDFLRFRLNLGIDYVSYLDRAERKYGQAGGLRMNNPVRPAELFEGRGDVVFLIAENTLNFQKSFGKNNINAVVGYSEQKNTRKFTNATAQGFGTGPDYFWSLGAATGSSSLDGGTIKWTKRSYFTQVAYDFDERYLLTGAFRRDGSSRVDPANKWGNFYAFSGGWRISKEAFFEGVTLINDLKLRGSYGELGNELLPEYLYQALLNPNVSYPFGGSQVVNNGAIQNQLSSLNLKWERRVSTNIGFDVSLLESRVNFTADYYTSKTKDALINPAIPLFLGNSGTNPYTNLGRIQNKGFEFQLGYSDDRKDFRYGASANLTTLNNEVLSLSGEGSNFPGGPSNVTRTEAGQPIGAFFLRHMTGIFQSEEEINNYVNAQGERIQPGAQPGDVRYEDVNGDGRISDDDRRFVGNPFPKIQYGLNLNLGYKGLDLVAFFQGVQGNDIYNLAKYWSERMDDNGNWSADLQPWTPQNPSTTTPRALLGGGDNALPTSDRWLENGSYFRLKNVQLGYTFPKALTEKSGLGSVRVYVTGQNLFTITDYTGYDPEIIGSGPLARGVDPGSYPNLRTVTGGIQIGF